MGIQTFLHKKHVRTHHTSSFPCSQKSRALYDTQCCTKDAPLADVGWAGFGCLTCLGKGSKLFSQLNGKMSSVIKPNTTMGIIKVLLDNRVKDK